MQWAWLTLIGLGAPPLAAQDGTAGSTSSNAEVISAQPAGDAAVGVESGKAESAAAAPTNKFNPGSGRRGTLGIHRIEAAHPLYPGELVLSLAGSYAQTNGMFAGGDTNDFQYQALSVAWSLPWWWVRGLELHLHQSSTTNTYSGAGVTRRVTQTLGDPELTVKYSHTFLDWIGVGGLVSYMAPTSAGGAGLKPDAFKMTFLAMGSFAFTDWLEMSANVGYLLDFSNQLFPNRNLEPDQIFSAQIGQSNQVLAGLGVATDFDLFNLVGVGPFVEFSAGFGEGPIEESPIRFTGGAKVYPVGGGLLELVFGADVRILGAPGSQSLPGIPPWEIFGRLSAHLFGRPDPSAAAAVPSGPTGPPPCDADDDCPAGRVCLDGACGIIKEVTKVETQEVVKPAPTWRAEGKVTNKADGQPITSAIVEVVGADSSSLAVDEKSGGFKTYPLPTGDGLVQIKVRAPGYLPGEVTLPRGKENEVKAADVVLQALDQDLTGEVRGSLKDARTGKALNKGQVFIPKLNAKIQIDEEGKFESVLKAGRFQILISSKGYITQKKEIEIRPGDVVILNVDLQSKRR